MTDQRLTVHATPGSKRPGIVRNPDGSWTVRVSARAVDGQANAAIVRAVARELGVAPSRVTMKRGQGSRTKLLLIPTDSLNP